jgi:hypothetical protein
VVVGRGTELSTPRRTHTRGVARRRPSQPARVRSAEKEAASFWEEGAAAAEVLPMPGVPTNNQANVACPVGWPGPTACSANRRLEP